VLVPEPLFHAFDVTVPDAAACLDRVYDAFADIPVRYGWCRQCFTLEEAQRMRAARGVRRTPLAIFAPIYFEHPDCSGGVETFVHWLPRGLELGFFDGRHDPGLTDQLMRIGLWRRPAPEQAAVRALLTRVACNWFGAGHVAPMQLADPTWLATRRGRLNISRRIVEALLFPRVEPASIFDWLMALDQADAWECLLDMVQDGALLVGPAYYVLADAEAREAMVAPRLDDNAVVVNEGLVRAALGASLFSPSVT
jgi:hypothetical protein